MPHPTGRRPKNKPAKPYADFPAANLFPPIEGDDFAAPMGALKENGSREDIGVSDCRILDGRNRRRACQEAKVESRWKELPADADPIRCVISVILHRRRPSETREGVAAEIANVRSGQKKSDMPASHTGGAQGHG